MNKSILITLGFIVTVLAQWFVPAQMILEQEKILTAGTAYKFRTIPIDPTDPLRGKYITLSYEINNAKVIDSTYFSWGDDVYVYLEKDAKGFAKATHVSAVPLKTSQDYVIAKARNSYSENVNFDLPFDTFYMDENKAYDAEVSVRKLNRDSLLNNCYGLVKVYKNKATLENVFLNDIPIKDYVEQQKDNSTK